MNFENQKPITINTTESQRFNRINPEPTDSINDELIPINDGLILEGEIAEFVPLEVDNDYEILSVVPHTIRRKDNHKEVRFNYDFSYHGSPMIILNGKIYSYDKIMKIVIYQLYKTESEK